MKRLVVALVLATSVFALSAMADEMKGYISDSKCGAKHVKDHNAKCIEGCVKGELPRSSSRAARFIKSTTPQKWRST